MNQTDTSASREVPAPDTTIWSLLHRQIETQPGAVALLAPDRRPITYAGLGIQLKELTALLRSEGVTSSSRVAVMLPNGPEMAAVLLGVVCCAVCVPLNPAYQAAELQHYLKDTGAGYVVIATAETGPVRAVAQNLGIRLLEIVLDSSAPAGQFIAGSKRADAGKSNDPPQPRDIALLLPTSGTTARPKIVPLSHANLVSSVGTIITHFGLSATDRCLNVRPLFHGNGLISTLLSTACSGGSVVCMPGLDGELFFDWIAQYQPTWYSLVPAMHQWVLAHGDHFRLKVAHHRLRFVRSGAAALAPTTLQELEALMGVPVIEAYGMTERTPIALNPLPPALRKAGSVGLPAGVEIRLVDAAGQPVSVGALGEITIRGSGVTAGYERCPDTNASAFVDGWFRTGDQGRFDDDGYLFITGRINEIINRGGNKVSPREVEEALLEHPGILQAVAFAVPHPTLGDDLAAAIVPRDVVRPSENALREFLFSRLAEFKIPSAIISVDAFPVGDTGKVQRHSLHEKFGYLLKKDFVAPHGDLECALATIFCDVLEMTSVGRDDVFFALGGDSLSGVRVTARINDQYDVSLPATTLFHHPSIAELAVVIEATKVSLTSADGALEQEISQMSDEEVARALASFGDAV